ncbi:hypothetical protein AGLY_013213 [Aphis glycines]|uniref:Uncharacterized protein n=1 Tax=Aphis glycines TaxID=307491 RepID=A0A6G0T7U2_APHGL|nr:hypothetical protein AGLY_013213 [Aphis glycines]
MFHSSKPFKLTHVLLIMHRCRNLIGTKTKYSYDNLVDALWIMSGASINNSLLYLIANYVNHKVQFMLKHHVFAYKTFLKVVVLHNQAAVHTRLYAGHSNNTFTQNIIHDFHTNYYDPDRQVGTALLYIKGWGGPRTKLFEAKLMKNLVLNFLTLDINTNNFMNFEQQNNLQIFMILTNFYQNLNFKC